MSISLPSQHVIGFMHHNQSMLIGFFKQKRTAKQWKWLFISADITSSMAGMRGRPYECLHWRLSPPHSIGPSSCKQTKIHQSISPPLV